MDTKELLQRSSIRTMKKDLKKLREGDVVRESQKIINQPSTSNNAEAEKQKNFLFQKQQGELKNQLQSAIKEKEILAREIKKAELTRQQVSSATLSEREKKDEALRGLVQKQQGVIAQEVTAKTNIAQVKASLEKIATVPKPLPQSTPTPLPPNENEQRKKFMADVEAWANSNK